MSGSEPGFQFYPEWRISLFTAILVPCLIGLGFWQLQRADEKAALANMFEQRQAREPVALASLWDQPAAGLGYLPVLLEGRFLDDEYLLLDNRLRDGRFGYEVLAILLLAEGDAVLVNRGWLAADPARRTLPEVPRLTGAVAVTGQVYVAPGAPYMLAEQVLEPGWPKRIQAVEMDKLVAPVAQLVSGRVFPYPVRIDAGQSGALATDWQVLNMRPQKHVGYAVQWFTMAAVLMLLYILRSSNLWQVVTRSRRIQV